MRSDQMANREELKARICSEIDSFYEALATKLERRALRIDDVERVMKEKKAKITQEITESVGKALKESEPAIEKNDVPGVGET